MPLECTGFRVGNGVKSDVSGDGRMSTIVKPLEVKQPLVLYNNNNNNKCYLYDTTNATYYTTSLRKIYVKFCSTF